MASINWNDLGTRCDLSGLLVDGKKYHVNLQSHYQTEKLTTIRRSVVKRDNEFIESTSRDETRACIFAWHKVLNVFAGGDTTAISISGQTSWGSSANDDYIASVFHHSNDDDYTCYDGAAAATASLVTMSIAQRSDTGIVDSHVHFGTDRVSPNVHAITLTILSSSVYELNYAKELFNLELMTAFCETFEVVLAATSHEPTKLFRDVELITPFQAQRLDTWNLTDGDYDRSLRLNTLIERSTTLTPAKTAVVYKDRTLTFQELNQSANQLANYLRNDVGVETEQVVALFMKKSEFMITTILAMWKSGAAYTPIDTTYPDERVVFNLEDTGTKVLLTTDAHIDRARRVSAHIAGLRIISLESIMKTVEEDKLRWPCSNPSFDLRSDQLAYLTYTSGTTGVPKGIKKRHTNVVNSITDLADRYEVKSEREAIVLFSPYVFEPFARQTLMALSNSQTLVVVDDDVKMDPVAFAEILRKEKITYLNGTASVLLNYDYSNCPDLKRLVLVGEDLTERRYQAIRSIFKHRVINEYGFTESAFVTAIKIFDPDSKRPNRSLGRPLRNVKCYILDKQLKRLPPGAIGGLYIGGQGIAEGYWNRPDLTAEKFLPNPFQTAEEKKRGTNSRIYYTGDLARWIPGENEVEYCGRVDFQIKLRGIRIEPGEIESVLSSHDCVEQVVVVAKTSSDTAIHGKPATTMHLVGYWTGRSIPEADLISFLELKLPRYMVPTRLINIAKVPTTINGKIDFRALPAVELVPVHSSSLARPMNGSEAQLRMIWSELLSIPESSIGTHDSFFRLGGNSIVAIQLVGRVRQRLNSKLTVEQIFAGKNIETIAKLMTPLTIEHTSFQSANISPSAVGLPDTTGTIYPANSLQQGFMYHFLKNSGKDSAYTMQTVCSYSVAINQGLFRKAWKFVQSQHSTLRLRLVSASHIYQVIDADAEMDFRVVESCTHEGFEDLRERDLKEPFALDRGSLFRVYLVRFGPQEFKMLFNAHHAILDGWSIPILLDRVHQTYIDGQESIDASVDAVYHAAQQLSARLNEVNLPYWRDQVGQISERCDLRGLMVDSARYKVKLSAYDTIQDQRERSVSLGESWKLLKDVCVERGIMLHTILQFVAHKVVRAYGNGRQSVVGTIVSGRDLPLDGIESALGLFINTLPLIVDHDDLRDKSVAEALEVIQQKSIAMNMRACVEIGKLTPGKMTHELFDCLLVLENYPALDKVKRQRVQEALQLQTRAVSEKLTYPLVFVCTEDETSQEVDVTVRYAAELFSEQTIEDVLDVFSAIFAQLAEKLQHPVSCLELLGPRQVDRLASWNTSNVEYPEETLDVLFEHTAAEQPDKIAVIYEDDQLTYAELNAKANQLARLLRKAIHAQPDQIVGLLMVKNIDLFISIFAVWKAGMAYTPINPSFPADRISYILKDIAAAAVLVDDSLVESLAGVDHPDAKILSVQESLRESASECAENLVPISKNTDLAYIYFTSGTTGMPKGVMIEHRGVVNLQRSLCKTFGLRETPDEVLLSFSNYTFDHFVEQMTDALLTGQTLLILNDDMRADKDRLYAYITLYRVTYLSGTPSVISMYDYEHFPWMRRIDCVGEDFSEPVFDKIRKGFDGIIINGYGPTEDSITSHKRLYHKGERRINKSIGFQIDNHRTYVLNSDMKRVPIGAIGELYSGGDGVGRGYLNRSDLTLQRFPQNPYQTEDDRRKNRDARLYKTGDLVRWLPTGEIEYLGREDFQIKLRGQRVELGEIEAAITSCEAVVQSVVVPRSRKIEQSLVEQKFLTGYFVATAGLIEVDIKNELRSKLPEHLIPNRLVQIASIPVTASGKLDSKNLPEVDYSTGTVLVPPGDDGERKLCCIWGTLLGLPPADVSVAEHFVTLGGDSLLSTKLAFVTSNEFHRRVTVADIFKHRTIRELAKFIRDDAPAIRPAASRWAESDRTPARPSLAQERLLFIDEFLGRSNAYNVLKYLSIPHDTSRAALRQALSSLIIRHEALRTLLVSNSASKATETSILPSHLITGNKLPFIETSVGGRHDLESLLDAEARFTFDLQHSAPVRVTLAESRDPDLLILAFNIHHTAFDAWSWNILKHDLVILYSHHLRGVQSAALAPLSFSHAAYSTSQRQVLQGDRGKVLQKFWTTKLADHPSMDMPTDFARPSTFNHDGADRQVALDATSLERVRETARESQVTPFSIFTAAYCLLLWTYTENDEIIIGLPLANRTDAEVENIVGCFINMIALRVKVDSSATVLEFVKQVHGEIEQAALHQEYPFEQLVKTLKIEYTADRHPIFQHVFSSDIISAVGSSADGETNSVWPIQDFEPQRPIYSSSKADLSTTVTSRNGQTIVNFNYPKALFAEATIGRFANTYQLMLEQVIADTSSSWHIGEMILTNKEGVSGIDDCHAAVRNGEITERALHGSACATANSTTVQHKQSCTRISTSPTTLVEMFEDSVGRNPNEIALVTPTDSITYLELDQLSSSVANALLNVGLLEGQFVGLMMGRSIEMIVCVLAAWKAGLPYVPMDLNSTPQERLKHIVEETELRFIITQQRAADAKQEAPAAGSSVTYINYGDLNSGLTSQTFTSKATKNSFAYCIYTSGTTGRPKGVVVQQKNVVSFAMKLRETYFGKGLAGNRQTVLMISNFVFDFSIEQFALSFLSGNKLVLLPQGITGDDQFYKYLDGEHVSYISGTPSVLAQLDLARLQSLRMLTSAGEQLQPTQFARMRRGFHGPINNAYGTTETTVYNLIQSFPSAQDPFVNALGNPLPGQQIYVVNKSMQVLPDGAVGELVIAGDGVAVGYLKRPKMTSARFINDPFSNDGSRLYRTGDIVRRLPGGTIEYRGRRDKQIKLRGFRIELDEVQAALGEHPDVQESVVLPKFRQSTTTSGSADYLVAWYTSTIEISVTEIRGFLAVRIPEAMIPSFFVRVPGQLPTTITGKLDVSRLPNVDPATPEKPSRNPRTPLEAKLCRIWSTMLGVEVGPDDDFFRTGGDSIMSLMFSRDAVDQTGLRITVKDVFEHRTIAKILSCVLSAPALGRHSELKTEQGVLHGEVPLLPIQKWFFEKNMSRPNHWNQTFIIRTPALDSIRLSKAVSEVCAHHDALHLSFKNKFGKPRQRYHHEPNAVQLHVLEYSTRRAILEKLEALQGSLDLETGQLVAAAYIPQSQSEGVIWMAVHHLAMDTQSWRILARDLQGAYEGTATTATKGTSFRQWSAAVAAYAPPESERNYWKNAREECSFLVLPFGPRHAANRYQFVIPKEQTSIIVTKAAKNLQLNPFDILLTSFGRAVYEFAGNFATVSLEGHGRDGLDDTLDVSGTVGWFTLMYPFTIPYKKDFLENLRATSGAINAVPNSAIGFGALYGYDELPLVSFNYLGHLTVPSVEQLHWIVQSGMDGSKWGRSRHPENGSANGSVLDVTAWIDDGALTVEFDATLSPNLVKRLAQSTQRHVIDAVDLINSTMTITTPPTSEDFVPYFTFIDMPRQGPTVFFFPPGEGGAESYFNNLVTALPETRLVTFNNIHLHSPLVDARFETLAAQYISWMRELQPHGPYHLLGWSFGGVLSFEVAMQLLDAGQEVASLALIDPYFNVRMVSSVIGHPEDRDILDPINWHYRPDQLRLESLESRVKHICLFKAAKANDRARNDRQKKLFNWYDMSEFNGLDSLIRHDRINTVVLDNETHFSWVGNAAIVDEIKEQVLGNIS